VQERLLAADAFPRPALAFNLFSSNIANGDHVAEHGGV